jgi:hypothetical protein
MSVPRRRYVADAILLYGFSHFLQSIDRPVKVLEQQLRDEARARAAFEEELRQLRALLDTQASGPSS